MDRTGLCCCCILSEVNNAKYRHSPVPDNQWFPHPLLSLVLMIVWLLLVNTVTFGHLFLGMLLGIVIPWFTNRFWPERPKIAKPLLLFRFSSSLLSPM